MARKRDPNSRRSKAEKRRKLAQPNRTDPNERVIERRLAFAFLRHTETEGRQGTIDQDIHDGIGQLHALGLLEGHGHDSKELRDKGRLWGDHYASLLSGVSGARAGGYERTDPSRRVPRETGFDAVWDRMNEALGTFERGVLITLLVDPLIATNPECREVAPWAQALINEKLIERGKIPQSRTALELPTLNDRELLKAAIRGLCQLMDASLPARWAA